MKYEAPVRVSALVGVFVVSLSAIAMMFLVSACPLRALVIIAVDIVAIYGLCACGSRANFTAA